MPKSLLIILALCVQTASAFAITPAEFKLQSEKLAEFLRTRTVSPGWPMPNQTLVKYQFEKVQKLETFTHTQLVPDYSGPVLTVKIQYDPMVEKNPELLLRDLSLLVDIPKGGWAFAVNVSGITSFHVWAELAINASAGHMRAQERLSRAALAVSEREAANESSAILKTFFGSLPGLERQVETNAVRATREYADAKIRAEAFAAKLQRDYEAWAKTDKKRDQLEKMDEKLNDLVLKNDRLGVRRMIEAYIPWTVLTPTETEAWKVWLEAIEFPRKDKSVLVFRGVDYYHDKIQRLSLPNGEERIAFLAPVLTKNQGSYTRRLRSLVTNRLKNGLSYGEVPPPVFKSKKSSPGSPASDGTLGSAGSKGSSGLVDDLFPVQMDQPMEKLVQRQKPPIPSAALTNQFQTHAQNAMASTFLSFTDNVDVIAQFSDAASENGKPQGGMLAVRMDSRRMVPNIMSILSNEKEYLAPLIVFPDEVVAYTETGKDVATSLTEFKKLVRQKTGAEAESFKLPQEVYQAKGSEFFNQLDAARRTVRVNSCKSLF